MSDELHETEERPIVRLDGLLSVMDELYRAECERTYDVMCSYYGWGKYGPRIPFPEIVLSPRLKRFTDRARRVRSFWRQEVPSRLRVLRHGHECED